MTTPPTNRPMTGEDVKLLKAGDVLAIDTGGAHHTFVRQKSPPSKLICAERGGREGFYMPYRFRFVSRPAPEPERDGAVERLVGDLQEGRIKDLAISRDVAAVLSLLEEARGDADRLTGEMYAISAAIGTTEFMDPPDGGDVSLAEQVRRMRAAQLTAERQRDEAVRALEQAQSCLSTRIPGGVLNGDETMSAIRQALQSTGGDR